MSFFCANEKADYEIYEELMSTVYFLVSKYHLININMKESSNTYLVVNKKSVEINNELGQSLLGVQIYPNSESESFVGRSKKISSKVDFNINRDPNIPLLGKMCASLTLSCKSYILYQYLEIILTNYDHLSKE